MTDSRGRAAPGAGDTHRGLALPGRGDLGGNAAHIIKQSKGAQNRPVPRPFLSFLKVPTARKEKISNPGQIRDTPASSRKKSPAEAGRKHTSGSQWSCSGPMQAMLLGLWRLDHDLGRH